MMRAFIKVDPDTGEMKGYSECPVHFDANGDEIPLKDISGQGYLQIEVALGGSHRDDFVTDLNTMEVTRTTYVDTAPTRRDDPAYIGRETARKAKSAQRIATHGKPVNAGVRKNPKTQPRGPKHAPAPGEDMSKAGALYRGE